MKKYLLIALVLGVSTFVSVTLGMWLATPDVVKEEIGFFGWFTNPVDITIIAKLISPGTFDTTTLNNHSLTVDYSGPDAIISFDGEEIWKGGSGKLLTLTATSGFDTEVKINDELIWPKK